MNNRPSGKVTFLFTDIEGSTKLAQDYPLTLQKALERHHEILNKAVESNNGFVFEIIGDAFCCAFSNAEDAVKAAVDAQLNLIAEKWNDAAIKVRIGIHSGEAEWNGNRYTGYITLARSARVMSSAYGEQIIISNSTYDLVKDKFDNVSDVNISFRDLGERRLKDVIQPIRLFQIMSLGLREEFPPLKTLDARPNNLPVQLTSFIGREEEIKKVKDLIRQTHLLTLTGPGGGGKTRLALQIAADIIDDFSNGIWFIELAAVSDPAFTSHTLMKVFKLKEEQDKTPEDILCDYLKERETLIILDNCEQIIDSCAALAETLLSICPKLKILATSREALRCRGEKTFSVSSLDIPDPNEKMTTEKLEQYEAVRLFIERALTADSDFKVNNENAPAVAQICYQLDGIPLAIELAAARIKILSVEKINEKLSDRFSFLTEGKRTALPRQQTLKAMVDWSYELLSGKEKLLLNRLSVFSDGCTLEAAEDICSDNKLRKSEILDLLSQLTDKSLIIAIKSNQRYRMLETIRQYAGEKLASSENVDEKNELDSIMLKHLDFYTVFAEKAREKIEGESQKEWMEKIEYETFNFRVAILNSIVRDKVEKGLRIAINLSRYWEIRGYNSEAKNYFEELLNAEKGVSPEIRANAYQWMGSFEWITGNYERSKSFYERSLSLNKETGNKKGIGILLNNLGLIANATGEYEKSKSMSEESCRYFREINDERLIADSLLNLGAPLINLRETEYAENVFNECLIMYRKLHDDRGIAMALTNLGSLAGMKSDFGKAMEFLNESLSIQRDLKDNRAMAVTLENMGSIEGNSGKFSEAEFHLTESIKIHSELGNKKGLAGAINALGFVKYSTGQTEESANLHKESLKMSEKLKDLRGIKYSSIGLAESVCQTDPVNAAKLLGSASRVIIDPDDLLERDILKVYNKTMITFKEILGADFEKFFEEGKGTMSN